MEPAPQSMTDKFATPAVHHVINTFVDDIAFTHGQWCVSFDNIAATFWLGTEPPGLTLNDKVRITIERIVS